MIQDIIKELQDKEHYNIGETIEFAKGKNELVTDWSGFKSKIKRLWRNKKR